MPTNVVLDAEHDITLSDESLDGRASTEATGTATEKGSVSDINEIVPDLALQGKRKASAFRPIARGVIKPLIAVLTAQYVIVAALVAGVAVTVAHHASHLINEKFAAIVTALKRL
jgi:hypothetical protein